MSRCSVPGRRVLLMVPLLLWGCAEPGAGLSPTPPIKVEPYRLGAGDVVRVTTFGEQSLTGEFRVSDSGTIAIPLLGAIGAEGRSVDSLAGAIAKDLKDKNLFSDPNVTVEVVAYRPVYILGEVTKPGRYPFEPGMTVLTAVSIAGGFTIRAVKDYAALLRHDGDKTTETKALRETLVRPGDVITVFERTF